MTASLWLAAGLAYAQLGGAVEPAAPNPAQEASKPVENVPAPKPALNKITAVTVYQGQALVTREVTVPDAPGTYELVVTPLPPQAVDRSLFAEGGDGLRVLSTRFRSRAVKADTRQEVRAKEEQLKSLAVETKRLQAQIAVQHQDLQYLQKLENFTGATLTGLTEKGRLDSDAIITLSKFVMESRATKSKTEADLNQQVQASTEAAEFARRQVAELSSGSSRIERDAVIVVQKSRPEAGTVRLGYLVSNASWSPQYRLRGAADLAPVRLEYLASVAQQTGEDWPDVRVTLSTARPSLDAAPPELLPLQMSVAGAIETGPIEAQDDRSQRIVAELAKAIDMPFKTETPLEDVIKYIRASTRSATFPEGIPIYVDPVGLQESEKTMSSPVVFGLEQVPLRTSLRLMLGQLGMTYRIKDGLMTITNELHQDEDEAVTVRVDVPGNAAGMAGMGNGPQPSAAQQLAAGGATLNLAAASEQAEELRVTDSPAAGASAAEKDGPSVTFAIAGRLSVPSRKDPQLLEVARAELPAEYHAKAVPVLTPRVYRLAKLANKSDLVLLPGEATVYVGSDFVGRMRLPLVAAGEQFVAGFGVDPQLQVSRRLVRKTRSIQGGNQVFHYEFRIGLRNYRSHAVQVQLWDRLPKPQGEAVDVALGKTSVELSKDALYERAAKLDNLLRWDVDLAPGTVGDKALYLTYDFRLESARDLPQPHFVAGGLGEKPIGGGAMGGMGGMMGGGMRSLSVTEP